MKVRAPRRGEAICVLILALWCGVAAGAQEPSAALSSEEKRALALADEVMRSTDLEKVPGKMLTALAQELGEEHPLVAGTLASFGLAFAEQGHYRGAREFFALQADLLEKLHGTEHEETLAALNNLAIVLQDLGDFHEASSLHRKVLKVLSRTLGEEHLDTLITKANLGNTLVALADLDGARRLFAEVMEVRARVLGAEHPDTLAAKANLAVALSRQGDFVGARQLNEEVLGASRRTLGEEHPDTVATKMNLAVNLKDLGDFQTARQLEEEVLDARRRSLGGEHPKTVRAQANLARTLKELGHLQEARKQEEEILAVLSRLLGAEHRDTLIAKTSLAVTLKALGDYGGARRHEEEALEALSRSLGEEHPDVLMAKLNLASTLSALGEFRRVRDRLESVLEIMSRTLGEDHPDTLKTKANLAMALEDLGILAGARGLQQEVYDVMRRQLGEDHPDTLKVRGRLAGLLAASGDLRSAREQKEELLEIRQKIFGEEHPETLGTQLSLAITLENLGDLAAARQRYEKVLDVRERILGEEHPSTVIARAGLAGILRELGDLAAARRQQEEVLEIRRKTLGEEHPDTVGAKADLAVTLQALGDLEGAHQRFQEVLAAQERAFGDEHPDTLRSKANLAGTLQTSGDLTAARQLLGEALNAMRRTLGQEHPDTIKIKANLALILRDLGDLDNAREMLEEVTAARRDSRGELLPTTEDTFQSLRVLAEIYRETGRLDLASERYAEALDALDNQLDWLDPSAEIKSRYRDDRRFVFDDALAVELARGEPGRAFHVLERYRAYSLLSLLRARRLAEDDALPVEIADELRQIGWQYDAITRQLDGLHPARDHERFQKLLTEKTELRRRRQVIRGNLLRQRRQDSSRRPALDLEGVQQTLDPGTVLLAYRVGPEKIRLFVLTGDGPLQSHELDLDSATLWLLVLQFRPLLLKPEARGGRRHSASGTSRLELGQQLFSKLLRPALDRISSAERLLIFPDGPLHYLPFSALTRPDDLQGDWRYLAEWKPIHTAQSATVYAELRARRPQPVASAVPRPTGADGPRWLAFGDPIYPGDGKLPELEAASRELLRLGKERGLFDGLEHLPHTRREVEEIARLFGDAPTRVYLSGDATEDHARHDLRGIRYLHFATHGIAYPDDPEIAAHPMDSFLALSLLDPEEAERKQLRENGLLQAWEIAEHLKLDADLVVLSACQTAMGENRGGEGLISLSRAFQIAGARTVLASLWAVNDASTAELMVRFYRHLLAGQPKDKALRAAQMELADGPIEVRGDDGSTALRDYTHSYYWAAFQVIGDWQ